MALATTATVLTALAISEETWKRLPADKKRRIRRLVAKGRISEAKKILGNPIEETDEYIHVRIRSPERYDEESFRVIEFDKDIKATIGCPKGKFKKGKCQVGTQIQKLMFPKPKWSKEKAKKWVKAHPRIRARRKRK